MRAFWLFLLIPMVEIALFIKLGGWLTLWPALGIVVFTAILGVQIVRRQGVDVLREMQASRDPKAALAHGGLLVVAGILLILPGFFTDSLGLLLLVPLVRRLVIGFLASRVTVAGFQQPAGDWVEGEYTEVTPREGERLSKWTER